MAAPTVARALAALTTDTIDLTGTTAKRLGVLIVHVNNGTSTGIPTAPPNWETAFSGGTLSNGVPTGCFVAQFYKVLDGTEGLTEIGGTAINSGTRRIHYQELATDIVDPVWQLHDFALTEGTRGTSTASISPGTITVTEECLAFASVMWSKSLPSGTAAPTWTPTGEWPSDYYNNYHGSIVEKPITVDADYSPTATLADSLTRSMVSGIAAYAATAPVVEPEPSLEVAVKRNGALEWFAEVLRKEGGVLV